MIKFKILSYIIGLALMTGGGMAAYNFNNQADKINQSTERTENISDQTKDDATITENNNGALNSEDVKNDSENRTIDAETNNGQPTTNTISNVKVDDTSNNKVNSSNSCNNKSVQKPDNAVNRNSNNSNSNNSGNSNTSAPSVNNDAFMAQVEQLIFNKVNEERSKNGVGALSYSSTMEKYARIKSKDMGDNNYFDHKDLSGNYITTNMKNDGVTYSAWAENIAYIGGVSDANALANQFMNNWMNSDGHRKNILSTNYTGIGVGVYKVNNKVYATQEFYK